MKSLNVAKDGRTYGWIKSIVFYLDVMEEPAVKQNPNILIKIEERVERLYNYLYKTMDAIDKLPEYMKSHAPGSEAKLDRFLEKIDHPLSPSNSQSRSLKSWWTGTEEGIKSAAALRFERIMKK